VSGDPPRTPTPDPDDWWASVGLDDAAGGAPGRGDRLPDESAPGAYRVRFELPFSPRTRLLGAIGIAMLVLLVGGLALAGVFSGSKKAAPPPTTPTTTAGTTTAQKPPATAILPTVTLKPGDTGTQVKRLQRALGRLGYAPGAVDGSYGPATVKAVESFQQAEGLTKDGVVGPKTLAALRQKLGG
jgi:hypothetical protein